MHGPDPLAHRLSQPPLGMSPLPYDQLKSILRRLCHHVVQAIPNSSNTTVGNNSIVINRGGQVAGFKTALLHGVHQKVIPLLNNSQWKTLQRLYPKQRQAPVVVQKQPTNALPLLKLIDPWFQLALVIRCGKTILLGQGKGMGLEISMKQALWLHLSLLEVFSFGQRIPSPVVRLTFDILTKPGPPNLEKNQSLLGNIGLAGLMGQLLSLSLVFVNVLRKCSNYIRINYLGANNFIDRPHPQVEKENLLFSYRRGHFLFILYLMGLCHV